MPFFILPPPPVEIPRTALELAQSDSEMLEASPVLKNLQLDIDYFESVYRKDKFNNLYKAWQSNTLLQSSISKIVDDVNFKRLVDMGQPAIPLIIEEIDKNPSTLVWALNIITGTSFSTSQRITIKDACKRWVRWWKEESTKTSIA